MAEVRPTRTTHEAARSLSRIFEPTDYPRFYHSLTEKGGYNLKSAYFSPRSSGLSAKPGTGKPQASHAAPSPRNAIVPCLTLPQSNREPSSGVVHFEVIGVPNIAGLSLSLFPIEYRCENPDRSLVALLSLVRFPTGRRSACPRHRHLRRHQRCRHRRRSGEEDGQVGRRCQPGQTPRWSLQRRTRLD